MRWYEAFAMLAIGALFLGAYLLSTDRVVLALSSGAIDRAYHDTYYVIAHRAWVRNLMRVIAGVALCYGTILWLGTPKLRIAAAATSVLWCLGVACASVPQYLLPRRGIPRRYADYPEAFQTWNLISSLGSALALICACLLICLLVASLFLRLRNRT